MIKVKAKQFVMVGKHLIKIPQISFISESGNVVMISGASLSITPEQASELIAVCLEMNANQSESKSV